MISALTGATRLFAWVLTGAITILSLVPPMYRPETGLPHSLEHFAIFAAAGLCYGIGYWRRSIPVVVGLIAFAGLIELAQKLVHGRHARLADFVVDAVAMCITAAAGSCVMKRYVADRSPLRSELGRLETRCSGADS